MIDFVYSKVVLRYWVRLLAVQLSICGCLLCNTNAYAEVATKKTANVQKQVSKKRSNATTNANKRAVATTRSHDLVSANSADKTPTDSRQETSSPSKAYSVAGSQDIAQRESVKQVSDSSAISTKKTGETPTGTIDAMFGNKSSGNEPMYITSDNLTVESKKRIFTYSGSVKMIQGDTNIDADVIVGKYDDSNVIQEITCQGNVKMSKGEKMKASSNRAVYTLANHTVVLTEGPEISHEGSILTADIVRVFLDKDRSEAEGNVKMKVIKSEVNKGVTKGTGQ